MNKDKILTFLPAAILVALFFGVALYIRIVLPYGNIFSGNLVKFNGTDTYYYMRIVDNLIHNFPTLIKFDPYMLYPDGMTLITTPFFSYLLAGTSWIIGLGAPTAHTVDVVSAYLPAIMGALTVVPVYFIGKALFNKWAGIIAAGLMAVLGGDFLARSTLGATDQHVAETLISTTAILFLILSIKSLTQNEVVFSSLKSKKIIKPLIFSGLTGVFLGLYLITWQGALMFVFIFLAYFVVQFFIDHLRWRPVDYLCIAGIITFVLATGVYLLFMQTSDMVFYSLFIAGAIPVFLTILSKLLNKFSVRGFFYPVIAIALGITAFLVFFLASPSLFKNIIGSLNIFIWHTSATISEMQPFILPDNQFTFSVAWLEFTTSFFLSLIAIGMLIYSITKKNENDKLLIVVWSLIVLAATLAQRRFAYYFIINVAVLTGYFSWWLVKFIDWLIIKLFNPPDKSKIHLPSKKHKKRAKEAKTVYRNAGYSGNLAGLTVSSLIIFFAIFFPNIGNTIKTASQEYYGPSNAWCETLSWVKNNTPDPFNDPNFYYAVYKKPAPGEMYSYPSSAYGVTSLWDSGYWITRIANRIPTSNPASGFRGESKLFAAQDEKTASNIMSGLNSKYVLVDNKMADVNLKFSSIVQDAGGKLQDYGDRFYKSDGTPVILLYPEYYRCLVVRLYNFDGMQILPLKPMVVNYEDRVNPDGEPFKLIKSLQDYDTYEQAASFIAGQKSGLYKIVSDDPFTSPVAVEKLSHFTQVYSSESTVTYATAGKVSEVKVFEYKK